MFDPRFPFPEYKHLLSEEQQIELLQAVMSRKYLTLTITVIMVMVFGGIQLLTWTMAELTSPYHVLVPLAYFLCLVLIILLISLFHRASCRRTISRWLSDHHIRPAQCAVCQYDLRGTPAEATSCPECGAAIAPITSADNDALSST